MSGGCIDMAIFNAFVAKAGDYQTWQGAIVAICCLTWLGYCMKLDKDDCMKGMQTWLIVSYMTMVFSRGIHRFGQAFAQGGENFIFSFRQPSKVFTFLVIFIWAIFAPFLVVWSVLGLCWFRAALKRAPDWHSQINPYFVGFLLALSYLWVCIYLYYFCVACMVEYSIRKRERNIRLIETNETRLWWGPILAETNAMVVLTESQGLQAHEIQSLPAFVCDHVAAAHEMQCSICLSEFCEGDKVRSLPGCCHAFHQSCIDVWLLRNADCPLCKARVQPYQPK